MLVLGRTTGRQRQSCLHTLRAYVEKRKQAKDLRRPQNEKLSTHRGEPCPCCSQQRTTLAMLLTAGRSDQLPHQKELWKCTMDREAQRHPELLIRAGALWVSTPLPGHETQSTRQSLRVTQQRLRVTRKLPRGSKFLNDFCFFVGRAALEGAVHRNRKPSAAGSSWRCCELLCSCQGSLGSEEPSPLLSLTPRVCAARERHLTRAFEFKDLKCS